MVDAHFGATEVQAFLDAAVCQLSGDWLLIGGALATVWLGVDRRTEDIDMIGLRGVQEERFALMDLAQARGLPLEAVNSAADFFVRRIVDWREQLEVLQRGPTATIHRPNPTLFLLLKIARLSETDLGDCLALIAKCDAVDSARVVPALLALPAGSEALAVRRATLQRALEATERRQS